MIKIFASLAAAKKRITAGSIKLLVINGNKIALAHTHEGLKAFENACPHQHEPLHKGKITPFGEVVCALHQYRFNLKTGREANNHCRELIIYPLMITDEGVFIDL